MSLTLDIPENWERISLPDIAILNMGQSPSSSDVNTEGNGIVFFQGKTEFGKLYPVAKKYCTAPKKIAEKNDILLSVRAPVGPTNLADQTTAIGRGLAAIKPLRGVEYMYLLYYFRAIEPWLSEQGTGSTFKAVSGQFLKLLPVALPSLPEQKQIAATLDQLLARVEAIKTRLDAIPALLKRFRQSVLAAAVSGRLTKEWREENISQIQISISDVEAAWISTCNEEGKRYKTPSFGPLDDSLPLLPAKWQWTRVGYVFDVYVGATPSRKESGYWGGSVNWVSSSEVAFCRIKETKETITSEGLANASTVVHPPGTVMLAMIGQGKTRGQPAILDIHACHNQNTAALRVLSDFCVSEYLYYYLAERYEETRRVGSGNNQQAMNKKVVQSLPFPLPPKEEQTQIVHRVEQLFAFADQIEQRLAAARGRVEHLTQSILAKAFRGELTAQWRADHPELISGEHSAQALLARIKAERAAAAPKKRSRTRRSGASPR